MKPQAKSWLPVEEAAQLGLRQGSQASVENISKTFFGGDMGFGFRGVGVTGGARVEGLGV